MNEMNQKIEIRLATPEETSIVGEIADAYVLPSWRSTGIGGLLVDAAVKFGRKRGWPFLEVGAPGLPRWQRTVDFYNRIMRGHIIMST